MTSQAFSSDHYSVLAAVHRDMVHYHNGRSGPVLGFEWAEGAGGQMPDWMRGMLDELCDLGLIAVLPNRMLGRRAHRVATTEHGERALRSWRPQAQLAAA